MFKILVTGGNGQLGNELRRLAGENSDVEFIFTDLPELDITSPVNLANFIGKTSPQIIINCAAYTAVDQAEKEPDKAFLINTAGVKNLAGISTSIGAGFIHVSTDFVFDGKQNTPYKESDSPNPLSVYGRSKFEGETYALKAGMVIRTSWLYSSFGHNFALTIHKLAQKKDEVKVIYDQIGTPTWAADLAHALITITKRCKQEGRLPEKAIYHYSNEGVCSWYDFAREIVVISGLSCRIIPIESFEYPALAKRPFYSVLNKRKIKDSYGIQIPHWSESLKKCLSEISCS